MFERSGNSYELVCLKGVIKGRGDCLLLSTAHMNAVLIVRMLLK